jgi:hypothetical protein
MHLFMALALLAATLPQAVVVKPVANMYAQPVADTEVVSQAIYGTNVGVVETRPGWLRVRTPDDYTGWVPAEDLRRLSAGEKPYAKAGAWPGSRACAAIDAEPPLSGPAIHLGRHFQLRLRLFRLHPDALNGAMA